MGGSQAPTYAHADGLRIELELPRLCGSRSGADELVHRIDADLRGKVVVINARLTSVGTAAYADELIALLGLRGAETLELTPTIFEFEQSLHRAAELRGLSLISLR